MDDDTLRARVEAWTARAAAARAPGEREACAELARHYAALLDGRPGAEETGREPDGG